jgi:hypothetical protein
MQIGCVKRKDYWIKKNKIAKINALIQNQNRELLPNVTTKKLRKTNVLRSQYNTFIGFLLIIQPLVF